MSSLFEKQQTGAQFESKIPDFAMREQFERPSSQMSSDISAGSEEIKTQFVEDRWNEQEEVGFKQRESEPVQGSMIQSNIKIDNADIPPFLRRKFNK